MTFLLQAWQGEYIGNLDAHQYPREFRPEPEKLTAYFMYLYVFYVIFEFLDDFQAR